MASSPVNSPSSKPYYDSCYHKDNSDNAKYVTRIIDDFPTPSERYYDIRVYPATRRSFFGTIGDQCILFHSNRICVVTIAPTHPIIAQDKQITEINYQFEGYEKIDRLSNNPQGKRKKGGQKLSKNAPICSISCTDGSKYVICACLGSKLIEINSQLNEDYDLIKQKPLSEGYIAILLPNDWNRLNELRHTLPKLCDYDPETFK